MMKSSKYIKGVLWGLAMLAWSACSNDDLFLTENDGEQTVTFRPVIKQDMQSRAIGDATGIDRLQVAVYEGTETLTNKFVLTEEWDIAQRNGIKLTLIEGHSYKILFWADDKDNSAYTLTDDGKIKVNYDDYKDGGFARMEEMDAFFATSSITVGEQKVEDKGEIKLSRPLGQLNFSDKAIRPKQGVHQSVVTFHSIPTSFNPFNGEVTLTDADDDSDDITFTFTDFPTAETLEFDNVTYYYVSCNYLFAPLKVSATLDLQGTDGTSINKFEFKGEKAIALDRNMKTNVYGNIVQQPEDWSVWDGNSKKEPTKDAQNRYIIDEAANIAWLSENAENLEKDRTFVMTVDIDMDKHSLGSIQLPAGSTLDGDGHTIKGLQLENALLGDVTGITIKNLNIEETTVENTSSEVTHVGVLVNTLKGSNTFSNIHIKSSKVSTESGAAGGIVGYISRKDPNNRNEILEVTFDDCHVTETDVNGSISEGHFVGLLRGYDNNETLIFNDNCTLDNIATSRAEDYSSPYTEGNESAWLASNDYSKYNGWLGDEECYRGIVMYGDNRFIPCWDGTTVVEPFLHNNESNKYEVYSAFDLAGVRNKTATPAALYLMENVDMNGQGKDGKFFVHENFTQSKCASTDDNNFRAFTSIGFLEGNNKGIYNVALNSQGSDRYAFILNGADGNVHQNINFHNCCTVVPHIVGEDDGQTVDKSYGATVVVSISGATYTMKNVHAYGCKVFALQKTGIIAGRSRASTMATIENCSVNDCYIENYDCKEHQENFEGLVNFYSPGEIGAFIGFIDNFATLKNCHVKGTTIYAFGQKDQRFMLIVTIPGRHIGQFIGDIRTSGKEKDIIKLENCTVDANTECTKNHDKYSKCVMIGKVYYLNALGIINIDTKGTVTLDGKSIL